MKKSELRQIIREEVHRTLIQEGTWQIPESIKDVQDLAKLLKKKQTGFKDGTTWAQDSRIKLLHIGDDRLWDDIGAVIDTGGVNADITPVIKSFIKKEMPWLEKLLKSQGVKF